MSDKAIIVSDLHKRYDLGSINSGTIKDDLKIWWSKLRDKEDPTKVIGEEKSGKEYWALKGVNFEIKKGESVGIIGKNGAGKSTLLKILSRVTAPTKGKIKVNGRIASLLEVGTGFHPDLSGRENIYMNGAILGMTRHEIHTKLDEIIAFSGVEKYVDTPVKRYSSGMYVRLAFAVAAHLEPEILIVDEVLAVGDAEFQKKCLGKMGEVAKAGRTVLFVSHNMQAVNTLCTHGIVLKKGVAMTKTIAKEAVLEYSLSNENSSGTSFPIHSKEVTIHNFYIKQNGLSLSEYDSGEQIDVYIHFEISEDLNQFRVGFFIKNGVGDLINRSLLADWNEKYSFMKKGVYCIKGQIPANLLVAGNYFLQVHTSRYGIIDYMTCEPSSLKITVSQPSLYNTAYMGELVTGTFLIRQKWEFEND